MATKTLIDEKIKQYGAIQSEVEKIFLTKQTLLSQFNENQLVKGELDLLEEDANVYKLVGPVLLSIELNESKQNVAKRLEFIEGELKKVDASIAAKQAEQKVVGDEVASLQQKMQAEAVAAAKEVATTAAK